MSDQEIAKGVEIVLRQSDPQSITTFDGVVLELQAKLGLDLSHKTAFIRDQINLLLRPQPVPASSAAAPPHPPQTLPHLTQNDRFALEHHPQFQQFPPHFALHHPIFPQDLNFRQPQVNAPPRPSHPQPTAKSEAFPRNAPTSELTKESSSSVGGKRRGGPGGLNKVCGVSPELQAVVGEPALPRTEIVKQLWAYIRKNNLQDPSNKRKIICDDALRIVFETDCTDMFKMNKLLAKHIIPLDPSKESMSSQAKRVKMDAETTERSSSTVVISDALAKFLGVGESKEMTQLEASKRVWEYIQANRLEDPLNSMVILCDAKLGELLGCESISAVGVEEMIARHHLLKR